MVKEGYKNAKVHLVYLSLLFTMHPNSSGMVKEGYKNAKVYLAYLS